jgi:hypothetical protein
MGYASSFWIQEKPIRDYLAENGRDDALLEEVGKQVLSLAINNLSESDRDSGSSLSFFNTPSVFSPSLSFHSTDFGCLVWTGERLCALPKVDLAMFDTLCEVASQVGNSHVVVGITEEERRQALASKQWQSPLEHGICASIFHITEDFTREFEGAPLSRWPTKAIGAATLNLMLSNWFGSEDIQNHGRFLRRCCSFIRPEFALIICSSNCLRVFSEIESDQVQKIRDYLGSKSKRAD